MLNGADADRDTRAADQAADEIARYLEHFPGEAAALAPLRQQLFLDAEHIGSRTNMRGHITSSAFAVDPYQQAGLLVEHRASGLWVPAGGHFEVQVPAVTESSIFDSAARELREETGLVEFLALRWDVGYALVPLDVETHAIAPREAKREDAHVHHDFLYVVEAVSGEVRPQLDEVCAARWFSFEEIRALEQPRLRRVLDKLTSRWSAAQ